MDTIAEKESFFNLLNSVIACAAYTHSPRLSQLLDLQHESYYSKTFVVKEAEQLVLDIHKELKCKHSTAN